MTAAAEVPPAAPEALRKPAPQPPEPTPFSAEIIAALPAGSTYVLGPGVYGPVDLKNPPRGLTLDIRKARVKGLRIYGAKDFKLLGGRMEGMRGRRGVEIYDSEDVEVRGLQGVGAGLYIYTSRKVDVSALEVHQARGFYAEKSEGVVLRGSKFMSSPADSVNFNSVKNLLIEDVAVIGAGYDLKDPLSTVNQHPDAIQGWGDNSKVTVRRVTIACRCQGVFIKDGANEDIVVEDVVALLDDYKWVVAVQNARNSPKLKNVKAWNMPGGPKPAFDFRNAQTATPWVDEGGNELNGAKPKAGDIKLK